ncbi:hypothetical protein ACFV4G_30595 [Kitasatospora sp. NPDC059747]
MLRPVARDDSRCRSGPVCHAPQWLRRAYQRMLGLGLSTTVPPKTLSRQ